MTGRPDDELNRRDFLKMSGAAVAAGAAGLGDATAAATQASPPGFFAAPPIETVRIGFVGVGLQGGSHVNNFLKIPGCRITAVCDIRQERTDWARKAIVAAGHPAPTAYTRGPRDFERLCETEDSRSGLHGHAVGMACAGDAGGDAERQARRHRGAGGDDRSTTAGRSSKRRRSTSATAVMMENCNYDRTEMMVFNIVAAGPARRDPARRGRLPARPARDQVRATATKDCGAAPGRRSSTATSIRPTGSGRSPTVSTSIAAIASTTWSR